MIAEIIRIDSTIEGTFGVMLLNERAFCCTLEEWWRDNGFDSCIPDGQYRAYRYFSPSKSIWVWQLEGVPDRDYIQIHAGNTVDDTLGCPLVASSFGKLRGNRAILNSGKTFKLLMDCTRHEKELLVTIRSAIPGMTFAV